MSVGCLGRYVEPVFDGSPSDADSLGRLAAHYVTSPEKLVASRRESAIAFGLNQIAGLFERADMINEVIS